MYKVVSIVSEITQSDKLSKSIEIAPVCAQACMAYMYMYTAHRYI
jgi:hypothetical protein